MTCGDLRLSSLMREEIIHTEQRQSIHSTLPQHKSKEFVESLLCPTTVQTPKIFNIKSFKEETKTVNGPSRGSEADVHTHKYEHADFKPV